MIITPGNALPRLALVHIVLLEQQGFASLHKEKCLMLKKRNTNITELVFN